MVMIKPKHNKILLWLFIIGLFFLFQSSCTVDSGMRRLNQLEAIFELPESEIDIARAMFMIDSIIDPKVSVNSYLKKLDKMVQKIHDLSPNEDAYLCHLDTFLYEKGPWNNNQTFAYDYDDPFGKKYQNHLVSNYMDTKKGNCVSMPCLYYLLGQKIGIKMYLSKAPLHLFVQLKVNDQVYALETTRKAMDFPLDVYMTQWDITKKTKENKLYYEPLTKKEVISVLLTNVVNFYADNKQYEKSLRVVNLALKYMPKNGQLIHNKAIIYKDMSEDLDYMRQFGKISSTTYKKQLKFLKNQFDLLYQKSKDIGYSYSNFESKEEILKRINRLKQGLER